jgi:hypothetical protein
MIRVFQALLFSLVIGLAACGKTVAIGDQDTLIVAVPGAAWDALQDDIERALEPRTFTVRDERILTVTPVDPESEDWGTYRRFRQVLLIGEPGDPWVSAALGRVRGQPSAPGVYTARDVWATTQSVTIALLPPGSRPDQVRPMLPAIGDTLVQRYREFAQARMFASGVDTDGERSLMAEAGFALTLPKVYRHERPESGTFVFRNDQPDPSSLIRSVLVTWRPLDAVEVSPDAVRAWREEVAERYYEPPQVTEADGDRVHMDPHTGVLSIPGVWSNPPGGFPAAGPFVTRLVPCPAQDRVYLLDGWLYAPGQPKFAYMVQLDVIMNSFRCGS